MYNPIEAIKKERARQVNEEGYSLDHDDGHSDESLAKAAACYAAPNELYTSTRKHYWPWEPAAFLSHIRKSRRRQLEIAGALIVAELERLARANGEELAEMQQAPPAESVYPYQLTRGDIENKELSVLVARLTEAVKVLPVRRVKVVPDDGSTGLCEAYGLTPDGGRWVLRPGRVFDMSEPEKKKPQWFRVSDVRGSEWSRFDRVQSVRFTCHAAAPWSAHVVMADGRNHLIEGEACYQAFVEAWHEYVGFTADHILGNTGPFVDEGGGDV